MIWFAIGHSVLCLALVLVGIFWVEPSNWWSHGTSKSSQYLWFGATIWGIGTCTALMVAAGMHHLRSRVALLAGGRRGLATFSCGMAAAIVGVILLTSGVIYLGDRMADGLLVAGSFGLGAWVLLMLMRRVQPGYCRACGFDVRGSLASGRCPECGRSFYSYGPSSVTVDEDEDLVEAA